MVYFKCCTSQTVHACRGIVMEIGFTCSLIEFIYISRPEQASAERLCSVVLYS